MLGRGPGTSNVSSLHSERDDACARAEGRVELVYTHDAIVCQIEGYSPFSS